MRPASLAPFRLAMVCAALAVPPALAQTASPAGAAAPAPDSKQLLEQVDKLGAALKDKPKSFEVAAALGNVYYENGRYLEAIDTFRQALEKARPLESLIDELRHRGVRAAASAPADCARRPATHPLGARGLEEIAATVRDLAPRAPGLALRCALDADEAVLAVRARRGDALYLIGSPDGALAEHQRVLTRSPDYPESLFFVGSILLEKSRGTPAGVAEGKRYWERLLKVAPSSPRAETVRATLPQVDSLFAAKEGAGKGGAPVPTAGGPSAATVGAVAEAAAQTERTPELEKGLDALVSEGESLLDAGQYSEARDKLVRVMPLRPQDARVAADLGAAMKGVGKTEMAERVLSRALSIDPRQPRALIELGKLLAARGDAAAAREKLLAARAADPAFARTHGVEQELARLK